jgi:hypothetical protein
METYGTYSTSKSWLRVASVYRYRYLIQVVHFYYLILKFFYTYQHRFIVSNSYYSQIQIFSS